MSAARCTTRAGSIVAALSVHVAHTGSVAGFVRGDPIVDERSTPWGRRTSWSFPRPSAASSPKRSPRSSRRPVVVEAANGPTTREAEPVLDRRGVVVVPDILANAGGVTASYFEWAQSRQGYAWDEELVAERLRTRMESAFTSVWAKADQLDVSMRRAAFALALERVAAAIEARGLFP